MRGTQFVALLVALLGVAQPAHALGICDTYLDESKLSGTVLAQSIAFATPAEYAELAWRLKIEFAESPGTFGPFVDADSPETIFVPKGFLKLNCELVLAGASTESWERVAAEADACLRRKRDLPLCLSAILPPHAARMEARLPTEKNAKQYRYALSAAVMFLLLHEFAHLALHHFDADESIDQRELEFRADLFAQRSLALSGTSGLGSLLIFPILSFLRETGETSRPTHDGYYCRFENIGNIDTIMGSIPQSLDVMPDSPDNAREPDHAREQIAIRRAYLRDIFADPAAAAASVKFMPQCRVQSLAEVERARPDLLALARIQNDVADSLPNGNDGPAVAQLLRRIIDLPLLTADGAAARMGLIASYAGAYRGTRSNVEVTRLLRRALELPDARHARENDFGLISRELVIRLMVQPPPGFVVKDNYHQLLFILSRGIRMSKYDAESEATLIRLLVIGGDCTRARQFLEGGSFPNDGAHIFDPRLPATLRAEIDAAPCSMAPSLASAQ